MATKILVNGVEKIRPGTYSQIKSGIKNPPSPLSFGNICIIDDGSFNMNDGQGAGVYSENPEVSGANAVYLFDKIQDFRSHVEGGRLYQMSESLFMPYKKTKGVSNVYYVRASESTPAKIDLMLTNQADTGEIRLIVQTVCEGWRADAKFDNYGNCTGGYSWRVFNEKPDGNGKKFIKVYKGTYKGFDSVNQVHIGGIPPQSSPLEVVLQSPLLNTVRDLVNWLLLPSTKQWIYIKSFFGVAGTDAEGIQTKLNVMLSPNNSLGNKLLKDTSHFQGDDWDIAPEYFRNGYEIFSERAMDKALELVKGLDFTFFLAGGSGVTALSNNNLKIFNFIKNSGNSYERFMVVGGGDNERELRAVSETETWKSSQIAKQYNSDLVIVCHGGIKKTNPYAPTTQLSFSSKYTAAAFLGRLCGLAPQTPITLKMADVKSSIHNLSELEQEFCLKSGIQYMYYDGELGGWCWGQGINTLQENTSLINAVDSTTFSVSLKRIVSQLNKEIVFNAKKTFFGKESGPNRATITETDIELWLEGFLQSKTATSNQDNLITWFGEIFVEKNNDNYLVNYKFTPNFEISKILFTGFIIEN
jgi:hypothetical protein